MGFRPGVLPVLLIACGKAPPVTPVPSPSPSESPARLAPTKGTPCGSFGCTQFDSVEDAFREVLAGDPRVLAIGEAHAPKGAKVPSSARRFTEALLPLLAGAEGHASDLLVELMNPPSGCLAKAQEVKKKQEVVTSQQAATDQDEYVTMGERARALGIVPDLLRPTCADMDAIRDAGDDAIEVSLTTIARLTATKVIALADRDERTPGDVGKIVVTYGGAIHNDRLPSADRESWSFGPAIDAHVKGRYTELDLYVPEFIEDTDAWKNLAWYPHYDAAKLGAKVTLFRPHDRSFVLIFRRADRVSDAGDGGPHG